MSEANKNDLDWFEILNHIQNFASSGSAKLRISKTETQASAEEAILYLSDIFDGIQLLNLGPRPFMESLDLFEPWFSRLKKKAVLKTLEIKDLRSFCLEVLALKEALSQAPSPWSHRTRETLMAIEEPLSAIDQIITPRGEIRIDASETLYRLTREKENLSRQVESTLDRLVKAHEMQSYLQDRYVTTREGRWVLPIRSGMQHSVPGVIHSTSQTKQTVFLEPEAIIPINNRLRQAEVEIEEEIERLLIDLSNYLSTKGDDFEISKEVLLDVDVLLAKAQWSQLIHGQSFTFVEDEFYLYEVRHPLMELSQKKPIPNTIHFTKEKSILILSGPNAGGKTILLKSIGLAAHMACCGLPICAFEGSRLPFFNKIHVAIGDAQSVDEELSTFAAHLKTLHKACEFKNYNHLIMIDEICGSTDPEEGAALARSFIEEYAKNQVFAVITSHLGPLKVGWPPESPVLNGCLEYDVKLGRPTYHFLPGISGDSLAIQTAKRVGISSHIITRATELLSPITQSRLSGLEEIESLKADIHLLSDQLKKETKKAQKEQEKFKFESEKLENEKEKILEKLKRETERKIEELVQQTKVMETFKRHQALQEIKKELPQIISANMKKNQSGGTGTNGSEARSRSPLTAEEFAIRFPPGSKVFVPQLNQDGIIQGTPNAKGEVLVLSNSLRLVLAWNELKAPQQALNSTAHWLRKSLSSSGSGSGSSSSFSIALQDEEDRSLDLRGKSITEALELLETELDQAAIRKKNRLKVIHGFGTEALKKAIRTFLSRSLYVKKWKAGSPEQGGDGITWIELGEE